MQPITREYEIQVVATVYLQTETTEKDHVANELISYIHDSNGDKNYEIFVDSIMSVNDITKND